MAVSRLTQTTLQNGFEKYNQVWDGRSAVGSMEAISAITLSATQSSVEFNNIPGTYSHLQIRVLSQTNRSTADNADDVYIRFNEDSTDNYSFHRLRGKDTTVDAAGNATGTGFTSILLPTCAGITSQTNIFGSIILDILDYTNTNKKKTVRALCGVENNATASWIALASGLWLSSSAITSVRLTPGIGTLFSAYSSFTLYGIK